MAPKKTYLALCGGSSNNLCGTAEERVQYTTSTAACYDTAAPNSKNEDLMLMEVLTDLGTATGMNFGLIVFVEETDQLVAPFKSFTTLQLIQETNIGMLSLPTTRMSRMVMLMLRPFYSRSLCWLKPMKGPCPIQ